MTRDIVSPVNVKHSNDIANKGLKWFAFVANVETEKKARLGQAR